MVKHLIYSGLIVALSLFFGACNDNNIGNEEIATAAPVIKAFIGNEGTSTRAGIVEDNDSYKTEGEKFYWTSDDRVWVIFKDGAGDTTRVQYKPNITNENEKKNTCDLIPVSGQTVPPGSYSVKAYFSGKGWNLDDLSVEMPKYILYRAEFNSKYMGQYMYMTAENNNVSYGGSNGESFSLNFKHEVAVVRFRLKIYETFFSHYDEWTKKTVEKYLQRIAICVEDTNSSLTWSVSYNKFPTKAEYRNGRLVPVPGHTADSMVVVVHSDQHGVFGKDLVDKVRANLPQHIDTYDGNKIYYIVDFYIPVLPFEFDFSPNDRFKITVQYKEVDAEGYQGTIRTPFFMGDFEHLAKGFKAGYSYFLTMEAK